MSSSRTLAVFITAAAACGHAASGGDVAPPEETTAAGRGGQAGAAPVAGKGGAGGMGTAGAPDAAGSGGSALTVDAAVAAAGAAGAPTPGGTGGTPELPQPVTPCSAPAQCDGFETGTVGAAPPPPFTVTTDALTPRNTVTVDDAHVFAGKRAVKIHVAGGAMRTAQLTLRGGDLFPPDGRSKVWGRMMLWMDAQPNTNTHWSNVEGFGYVPSKPGVTAYVRFGGQFQRTMANYDTAGTPATRTDCAKRSPQRQLPIKRWVCYEWMFDAGKDEMRLWLDGAPVNELTVQGGGDVCLGNSFGGHWYLPSFRLMGIGWRNYQDMGPLDLWVDEAGVGPERLGCPAKAP